MGSSYFFFAVWVTLLGISCAKIGGYNTAPNTQYHIQTDEGPERYFRYQTISGQYRKEKRLQDGTVVGTYGWVDSNGFLRLRDYIADNKGYRIVRTKMVNVGVDTPIATAVSAAKKVPSQGGVGVKNAKIYQPLKPEISSTPNSITSYPSPTKSPISLSDYLKQNQHSLSYHTTPSPISSNSYIPGQPEVFITPNSYYPPSSINDPSYSSSVHPATTSTPYYESSTPIQPQTFRPYFNHNSLQNYYSPEANRRMFDNVGAQRFETSASNDYPLYDGVSMTHNGFRYYLPRHYHEEETLPNEKRAGSFGYIDPFGIRRVIYYNASPGSGFVHRKNNRYVGFDATPYDPRY